MMEAICTYRPGPKPILRGLSRPILTRQQLRTEVTELLFSEISRDLCAIMAALRKGSQTDEARYKAPDQATRIAEGELYALDYCRVWNLLHRDFVDLWSEIAVILPPRIELLTTSEEYEIGLQGIVDGEAMNIGSAWLGMEATR